jgi:hypothetical protein
MYKGFIERPGRVVNTPASYSGGPGLKYRPRRLAIMTDVFVIFLSPSNRCLDSTLKLGHYRFD